MATRVVTWREVRFRSGAGLHPSDPPIGECLSRYPGLTKELTSTRKEAPTC
jgi:hypothetical protein